MEADAEPKDQPPRPGAPGGKSWRGALWALACLALHAVAAASGPHRHYDLPAGEAAATLNEFGRQSDLQVLFDFNQLKGLRTRAVKAELDASAALTRMLAGSGLVFEFVNEGTLAVTPAQKPSLLRRLRDRLASAPAPPAPHVNAQLEQVLISGSVENGSQPLLGAGVIQLTRTDIDRSGAATTQDFLHTLPQVFGGGPNANTVLGREAATNSARGSGINLRGLDAGATLVLIDGKRVPPSGTEGVFQDIANLPLSIIDHVDVMPDGSSARYGADAIGGVVNFVTRQNFSGLESQLRLGTTTSGGRDEEQVSQLSGTNWDAGNAFVAFEYYHQDALRAGDRWQATNNLTPFGGSNFNSYYGSPGTVLVPTGPGAGYYPLPRDQDGTSLTNLQPGAANLYDIFKGTDVTPDERRFSVFGKANWTVREDLDLFASGLLTQRDVSVIAAAGLNLPLFVPATNPFYVAPAGSTDTPFVLYGTGADFGPAVTDNRIDTGNFTVGLTQSAAYGWTVSGYAGVAFESQHEIQRGQVNQDALSAALADPQPATAFNPYGDGSHTNPATLAGLAGNLTYHSQSMVKALSVTAIGPVVTLPGGPVEATVGAEYRDQTLHTDLVYPTPSLNAVPRDALGRRIGAAFAELRIALIGTSNALRWARQLDISIGERVENYTDVGSAAVPKFGVTWRLVPDLNVRGTWTRSFRPPGLPDLIARNNQSELTSVPDAASPTGAATVLALFGTNPGLTPEHARSWTLGADFTPVAVSGLSLSMTYFNFDYTGRIDEPQISSDVLQEPQYAFLVNRNYTAAQLREACLNSVFQGSAGTCATTPIAAILDTRLRNIDELHTSGIDVIGRYAAPLPAGTLDLGLNGTYLLQYSQANTPATAPVNALNTQNNPIDLRLRGSAAFGIGGYSLAGFVNYANHYRDTLSVPNRNIAAWTTVDLQLAYQTQPGTGAWSGPWRFTLNLQNLFDRDAPFLNNPVGVGYDQENASLYGRVLSVEARRHW